jgi:hypothetical protein
MSASPGGRRLRSRTEPDATRPMRLTARDRSLITMVALHGAASGRQLVALGRFGSVCRANRRLRLLFDGGYLRRTFVAAGAYAAETIYLLGSAGASVAAEETCLDYTELQRQGRRQPERMFLEHHLAVLAVRLAAEDIPLNAVLLEYRSETECRHEYTLRGERVLIKPDGFLLVEQANQAFAFFVEVDRGTVSLPQMRELFGRYRRYGSDGAFGAAYDLPSFEVLVVTSAGDRRIAHLADLAHKARLPVRLATFDDLHRCGLYGRIWRTDEGKEKGLLWEARS